MGPFISLREPLQFSLVEKGLAHYGEKWKEGMVRKGEQLRVVGVITRVHSVIPTLTHRHACTGTLLTASLHDIGHEMLF